MLSRASFPEQATWRGLNHTTPHQVMEEAGEKEKFTQFFTDIWCNIYTSGRLREKKTLKKKEKKAHYG